MSDSPEWFAQKRYGYGAGLPISWQGWALTAAFLVIAGACAKLLKDKPLITLAIMVPVTVAFVVMSPVRPAAAGVGAGAIKTSRPTGRAAG